MQGKILWLQLSITISIIGKSHTIQHIGNKIHIDNEKKSKANRYIYDLVEEVSQKGKKRGEAHRRRR